MADLGLLAGIGMGLQEGVKSYQTERRYQDEKAKEEAEKQALKRRLSGELMSKGMRETADGYEFTPEEQEKQGLERDKLRAETLKARAAARYGGVDPLDYDIKQERLAGLTRQRDKEDREQSLGKQLPAGEAINIGGANAATESLNDAVDVVDKYSSMIGPTSGLMTRAAGFFGMGEAGEKARLLDASLKSRAQTIGKYLEGGKLTDSDIDRYKSMLPNIGDSKTVAQGKISNLQTLIAQKQKAETTALSQAGYNTSSMGLAERRSTPGGGLLSSSQSAPARYPVQVKSKDGTVATVSNAAELEEARKEGFEVAQ